MRFAFAALLDDLGGGFAGVAAVDADGAGELEPPAEEGDTEQLALGYEYLGREDFLRGQRFPAGLVFAADNGGACRDVFCAFHAVFEADDVFQKHISISAQRVARAWRAPGMGAVSSIKRNRGGVMMAISSQ